MVPIPRAEPVPVAPEPIADRPMATNKGKRSFPQAEREEQEAAKPILVLGFIAPTISIAKARTAAPPACPTIARPWIAHQPKSASKRLPVPIVPITHAPTISIACPNNIAMARFAFRIFAHREIAIARAQTSSNALPTAARNTCATPAAAVLRTSPANATTRSEHVPAKMTGIAPNTRLVKLESVWERVSSPPAPCLPNRLKTCSQSMRSPGVGPKPIQSPRKVPSQNPCKSFTFPSSPISMTTTATV